MLTFFSLVSLARLWGRSKDKLRVKDIFLPFPLLDVAILSQTGEGDQLKALAL